MKYFYDTVRPVTTVNELFKGSEVSDWRGNRTANIDDKDHWRPYQLRRNIVPPFPDNPSGHSAFSTSASVILRHVLGTNIFDYETAPFKSRFDLTDGFDGNPGNGNEEITLSWQTFSEAADAAGFSRLLGGIHMMQGNLRGLEMGTRVGHSTLKYLRTLFGDEDLGDDPVDDVFNDIVFGTGKDDALLVAPCVVESPVEVYGFYGDDVLEFNDQGDCGPISLFGGDGADTFRIGARATIQDYETVDTIVLLGSRRTLRRRRSSSSSSSSDNSDSDDVESEDDGGIEEGAVSISVSNSVTTVFVDGDAVFDLVGAWDITDLNISFE